MSEKRYYTDSYTAEFEATIVETVDANGRFGVILNHTYFYPTSGGQPYDTGHLNDTAVTDVTVRKEDSNVIHWLAEPLPIETAVNGRIDWPRRFDHMQQHSGQHILSQAFLQTAQANTVGFHLSPETVTIDLDNNKLSSDQINQAETIANTIVMDNRPIHVRFVTHAEAQQLPLRKIPPVTDAQLRLVDITDFDLTACGGTHVAHTGEIGLIKIIRTEKRGKKLRVEFRCGWRALRDYSQKNETIQTLSTMLTTGLAALPTAVTALQEENKALQRQNKQLLKAQIKLDAQALLIETTPQNGRIVITKIFTDQDSYYLRGLQGHLTQQSGTIALLGLLTATKTQLLFARAEDATGNMNTLIKSTLAKIGGSGGGSNTLAQGGGPAIPIAKLETLLAEAVTHLNES